MRVKLIPLLLCGLFFLHHKDYDSSSVQNFDATTNFTIFKFDIQVSSHQIVLSEIHASKEGILYFVLSDQEYTPDRNFLSGLIKMQNSSFRVETVPFTGKNISVKFQSLHSNRPYYLGVFGETFDGLYQSEIQYYQIKTTELQLFKNASEYIKIFIMFTLPIFVIALIYTILKKLEKYPSNETNQTPDDPYEIRSSFFINTNDVKLLELQTSLKIIADKDVENLEDTQEILENIKMFEEENREFEELRMCGICCERPREVIFLKCGHVYCCKICSLELQVCPFDKKEISSKITFKISDRFGASDKFLSGLLFPSLDYFDFSLNLQEMMKGMQRKHLTFKERLTVLKAKNENYRVYYYCIKCNKKKKDTLFLSCSHLICCSGCAEGMKTCPLDDYTITKKYHVFMS